MQNAIIEMNSVAEGWPCKGLQGLGDSDPLVQDIMLHQVGPKQFLNDSWKKSGECKSAVMQNRKLPALKGKKKSIDRRRT